MNLILIRGDEVRLYLAKDIDDAQYYFNRRIEKEGWVAEQAFLFEGGQLPTDLWEESYRKKERQLEQEANEREEKANYERLKMKFERKSRE